MIEKYQSVLTNESVISANRQLLKDCGCTDAQIKEFSNREFLALPKWLRNRLKFLGSEHHQSPKLKLSPKPGEYAFYLSPDRFPPQMDEKGKIIPLRRKMVNRPIFNRAPGVPVNPAPITVDDVSPHRHGIQRKRTGIPAIDKGNDDGLREIAKSLGIPGANLL
jgi:hypothetical protein